MKKKLFLFNIIILLLTLLINCYDENTNNKVQSKNEIIDIRKSPMNPHIPPKNNSWFEGWYYRITDNINSRTIAVVVGSYIPEHVEYIPGKKLQGYLAIIIQEKNSTMKVYERYLENTYLISNGDYLLKKSNFSSPADFEWRAEGIGYLSQDSVDLNIKDSISLQITGGERIPWNKMVKESGPEGVLNFVPSLPLHWYVYSLGTETEYDIKLYDNNRTLNGSGFMHQEKNWGVEFPEAWIWSQGVSDNNSSHFSLSGGIVSMTGISITTWLVGYFSDKIKWDFKIIEPGTIFDWDINACEGKFNFIAKTPVRTLKVKAYAPIDSFETISIPTENGFEPGAVESFRSTIEISAYTHDPLFGLFGFENLIERKIFRNAALEFGGDYRCGE